MMTSGHNLTDFSSYAPLPSEILLLPESETACQYCGISYLLLSKYERMVEHVKGLEKGLSELQEYARERPQTFRRLETLTQQVTNIHSTLASTQSTLSTTQITLQETQRQNALLTTQLTELQQSHEEYKHRKRQQINGLVGELMTVRSEVLDVRRAVNGVKAGMRESHSTFHKAIPVIHAALSGHINSVLSNASEMGRKDTEKRLSGEVGVLKKDLETAREDLRECEERNNRLTNDLRIQSLEASELINAEKNYAQTLESRLLHLEDALHATETSLSDLQHTYANLQTSHESLNREHNACKVRYGELERKMEVLEGMVQGKEREIKELQEGHAHERRQSTSDSTALSNAHRAMAQKDNQILTLERTIRDLNQTLQQHHHNHQKTIEAHQSRIGQLQAKFLSDLATAGKAEADKREMELRRVLEGERMAALRSLKGEMEREIDGLTKAFEEVEKRRESDVKGVEEEWERKYKIVCEQLSSLKASNAADFTHYQSRIRNLEEQLAENQTKLDAASRPTSPDPKIISELKNTLTKRDREIEFLKEMVRVECEERMGLIAELDVVRRGGSQLSKTPQPSTAKAPPIPNRPSSNPTPTSHTKPLIPPSHRSLSQQSQSMPQLPPARESSIDPSEKTFEALMKAAAARKGKVLAARSSADLGGKVGMALARAGMRSGVRRKK